MWRHVVMLNPFVIIKLFLNSVFIFDISLFLFSSQVLFDLFVPNDQEYMKPHFAITYEAEPQHNDVFVRSRCDYYSVVR